MRVAVVGAGVAGLTAAHRLTCDHGHVVDVYERWPGLGGMAATLDVGDGHRLERYYHHLFTSDRHIQALHEELGLGDEIEWLDSSTACFTRGRQWPFTTPKDLLAFGPLPPLTRIRMGAMVVGLQRFRRSPEPFEGVTAEAWVTRWMGRAAWDGIWGPMLRGKFDERADEIAMVWLWSKWMLRRQVAGEESRGEKLGYPRASFEALLRALQASIERGGGRVHIDRPVKRIGSGFELAYAAPGAFRSGHDPATFEEAGRERYDAVVCTVTPDLFLSLCDDELKLRLGDTYAASCAAPEHHGALCLLLELDRRFSPYYWTNVFDPRCPFIGLIEHTNFVDPERYGGRRFLYVANYLANDEPLMGASLDEVVRAYEPGMRLVDPDWRRDRIKDAWLFREPHAQPVVTVGYKDRLPSIRTPVDRLLLAGISQVYPEDRGTNYAVRIGAEAAGLLR